ncbi:MAG: glycosyl transferase group 1 [Solirubrobacterales bacterium]|nr:glycosyl transferase group 1 [Solirubrobacterales bacterium]
MAPPPLRALVVSNMYPSPERPALGVFVRDQVEALERLADLEVERFTFAPGGLAYLRAARALRRAVRGREFDVVHAHFGLTAWTALAARGRARLVTLHGRDVYHPISGRVTRAALPLQTVTAVASAALGRALGREPVAILPMGIDLGRFVRIPRAEARATLGLDPDRPCLLFPFDPSRADKRADRARALADATGAELLTLGGIDPARVPVFMNAANALLVPSDREGFGMACLEALACDVPVLATPVGIHPLALRGIDGCLCAAFELDAWRAAAEPHLAAADPRVEGRARAELFSADRMAGRVAAAWRGLSTP